MILCHREPTLEPTLADILSDSIIKAMMKADGVDPKELEMALRQMTRGINTGRSNDLQPTDSKI